MNLAFQFLKKAFLFCLIAGLVNSPVGYCFGNHPTIDNRESAVSLRSKPNIILIMVDDMGFSDIGCYGGEVDTPNLNRMASEGMRFTQFYNNAKCTTTRASLITGLYPRGHKSDEHLRYDMITLGEAMKSCNYTTALCGKWHLGRDKVNHPFHRGFDRFYGLLDGCCNFFDPSQPDPKYKGGRVRFFADNDTRITKFPAEFYTTDAFTDESIKFIEEASEKSQPFFLHLTYTAPHYPLHAKPKDIAKYRGRFKMGWDKMREQRWQRQKEMGLTTSAWKLSGDDSRGYAWESANHEFEDHRMAVYAAMIDSVDQNMGRILKALESTDQHENTLIMFLSDNGGCAEEPGGRDPKVRVPGPANDYVAVGPSWGWAQNAPFRRYKSWLNEGGITSPMIAWWPGQIPSNVINRDVAHIIDLMPTLLELGGGSYPTTYAGHEILPVEGLSMLKLLQGKKRIGHETLYWYWSKNRAIREGNWKLVWDKLTPSAWELYDLSKDRCEMKNLAEKHPDRIRQMSERWTRWAKESELKMDKISVSK